MITIHTGYLPGAIGRITAMHASYYHRHWGFGSYFEAKVASGLAQFIQVYQADRDGLWLAMHGDQIVGSIALDRQHGDQDAHLRWFILDPAIQGQGAGRQLLDHLLQFADSQAAPLIYLNTFAGLDAARRLYERAGFVLTQQQTDTTWGIPVEEQRFERVLPT